MRNVVICVIAGGLIACGPKSSSGASSASAAGSGASSGAGGASASTATASSGSASSGSGGAMCGASVLGNWSAQEGKPIGGSQAFFTPAKGNQAPAITLYDGMGQAIVQFSIAGATGPGMYALTNTSAGSSFTYYPTGSIVTGGQYSLFPGDMADIQITAWPAMKKDYASGTFSATLHNAGAGPMGEPAGTVQKTITMGQFCAQWH